ncbi:hypothetical protein B0E54_06299 [Micromonospora sp. MH99]|nr:hypothetical protein [Micromonospora sp. MH99]
MGVGPPAQDGRSAALTGAGAAQDGRSAGSPLVGSGAGPPAQEGRSVGSGRETAGGTLVGIGAGRSPAQDGRVGVPGSASASARGASRVTSYARGGSAGTGSYGRVGSARTGSYGWWGSATQPGADSSRAGRPADSPSWRDQGGAHPLPQLGRFQLGPDQSGSMEGDSPARCVSPLGRSGSASSPRPEARPDSADASAAGGPCQPRETAG